VLLSTPLPAYTSPHLLNVLIQIADKLGFKKKNFTAHELIPRHNYSFASEVTFVIMSE
jgi:hypothetical protein